MSSLNRRQQVVQERIGLCLCLSPETIDIQHSVRLLASYMANPTQTAVAAIKKLTTYLQPTQDMALRGERSEGQTSMFCRWKHLSVENTRIRRGGREHCLELFSDSDWASSRSSRKSTSSGLVFHSGNCIHSHSRGQASIALSSTEAEVLAATSLLARAFP